MNKTYIPEEITLLVSSNPSLGASNVSSNGDRFTVNLQGDGIKIPKEARNIHIALESSTIWNTIPNIITGVNDKLYLTGTAQPTITDRFHLGYDAATNTYEVLVNAVQILQNGGDPLPTGLFSVGNYFIPESGPLIGNRYLITGITTDTTSQLDLVIDNPSETQAASSGSFEREVDGLPGQTYTLTLQSGLYDLETLNSSIQRELENAGALQLISLSGDFATQKVIVNVNFDDVTIDFTQSDTFRTILGFNSSVLGPYPVVPYSVLGDTTAAFNSINKFLIHTDLVSKGIRLNGLYNQIIGEALINASPGSQIVSEPNNPPRVSCSELGGSIRNSFQVWITNESNESINMNGEYWAARLLIKYLIPA